MTLLNPLRGHGLQALSSPIDQIKFYAEGPLATVSVLENNLGERTIYVDDVGVAGTDPVLQTDQKSLAHMPMMLLENPKSALTVGFGSGGASYSLQLHDSLQRIDCAEICLTVLDAAPTLGAANHHFFARQVPVAEAEPGMLLARPALSADGSQLYPAATRLDQGMINVIAEQAAEERLHVGDPIEFARADDRYNIILDDARAWLRYTEHKYDFIATDCTDLRYKSNANLYDVEYFEACREHLTEDGIVVVWMPLAGLDREIFKTALRTFHHVFPTMGIFFMANEPTHYILMIGWQDDEIRLDYSLFARRLSEQDVRQDLAELFLDDPVKLLSCFVTASVEGREDALDAYLAGEELNTENHPVIEFRSPMYGYSSKPLIDNLGDLMAARVSPREFLDPATIPPAELARLEAYEEALPHVIAGHAALRNLEVEPATHAYLDALALTPRDLSVRTLLTFPILQKRIRIEPDNPLIHLWLGRALMLQDKLDTAYDLLARAAQLYQARLMREPPPGMTEQERNFDRVRMAEAQRWQSEIWSARRGTQSPAPPPALL